MKKILIITCLFSSCLVTAQGWKERTNELTEEDFYNIQLAGKSLQTIIDTQGQPKNVEALFGKALKQEVYLESEGMAYYVYHGFGFSFWSQEPNKVDLSSFEITNNRVSLVIKGVSIKIGDSIDKLGKVKQNTNRDGTKGIVYTTIDGIDYHFLYIDFDQQTKRTTEIGYIVQT